MGHVHQTAQEWASSKTPYFVDAESYCGLNWKQENFTQSENHGELLSACK